MSSIIKLKESTQAHVKPLARLRSSLELWSLVVLTVVGGYMAVTSQLEASRLRQKRLRLESKVGVFAVPDPKKYYVALLDSEDENEFRWRVYIPETKDYNSKLVKRESSGSSTITGAEQQMKATEGLFILTLLPEESTKSVTISYRERHDNFSGGGSTRIRDAKFFQRVQQKDRSAWRIVGMHGPEQFDIDQFIWLLRIREPNGSTEANNSSNAASSPTLAYGLGSDPASEEGEP